MFENNAGFLRSFANVQNIAKLAAPLLLPRVWSRHSTCPFTPNFS